MSSGSLSLIDALCSNGPADDRAERMMLYGQFVGSWDGTVTVYRANGERFDSTCEVHFGWALAGRAVQDVWIVPSRNDRPSGEGDRMYGTTLRAYDPEKDQWQITWIDPVRQSCNQMIGRQVGVDIVQEYRDGQGTICQWCFTEIDSNSFHWISRESADERETWKLTGEFHFKRRTRHKDRQDTGADAESEQLQAFDFWQGVWRVTDPQSGKELGMSKVERILGGARSS
jgi:hypothetical protein